MIGAGAAMWLYGASLTVECQHPCSDHGLPTIGVVTGVVGLVTLVIGIGVAITLPPKKETDPQVTVTRSLAQIPLGNGLALSGNRLLF